MSGPGAQSPPGPGMPSMLDGRPIDDRGPMVVAVCWTLTALASVFLALRLYCKYVSRRALWWDDWILIGAWVSICGPVCLCHLSAGQPTNAPRR